MNFIVEATTIAGPSLVCPTISYLLLTIVRLMFFITNLYALILFVTGILGLLHKKNPEVRTLAIKRIKKALIFFGIFVCFLLIDSIFSITPQTMSIKCLVPTP